MSKVTLELDVKKAQELIDQMPLPEKIKLIRRLQKETWAKRITNILDTVDNRRRKRGISLKSISKEIDKARQEFYATRR